MIYSICSAQFKHFCLTKKKILLKCFPNNSEQNLVKIIESFACSRKFEYFEEEIQKFETEVSVWGNFGILRAKCIPVQLRLTLLKDMLTMRQISNLDKIEEWNLKQVLIGL
jgi:hypothetical protein